MGLKIGNLTIEMGCFLSVTLYICRIFILSQYRDGSKCLPFLKNVSTAKIFVTFAHLYAIFAEDPNPPWHPSLYCPDLPCWSNLTIDIKFYNPSIHLFCLAFQVPVWQELLVPRCLDIVCLVTLSTQQVAWSQLEKVTTLFYSSV